MLNICLKHLELSIKYLIRKERMMFEAKKVKDVAFNIFLMEAFRKCMRSMTCIHFS